MEKKLYIIGNGFDLYHGLPTKYSDYAKWLSHSYTEVLEEINETFGDCKEEWWSDFEQNLASVDTVTYAWEIAQMHKPDWASDSFRDRDWYEAEYVVRRKLSKVYEDILESFYQWILCIDLNLYKPILPLKNRNSIFLTFNYTDTLETVYEIESEKIFHIHGRASIKNELVLGHGKNYEQLNQENPMPSMVDEYYELLALEKALSVVASKKKPTKNIIRANETFFNNLSDITEVIILGFSFSDIDKPYLDRICQHLNLKNVHWITSVYNNNDRQIQSAYFKLKRITNYRMINNMQDIGIK